MGINRLNTESVGGILSINAFFSAPDVPIAIKIAVPVVVLEVGMLLAMVIKDRMAEKSKEAFSGWTNDLRI